MHYFSINTQREAGFGYTYVATFLSSWMLNKYSNREKFHLISCSEGKETSNWSGVGLSKELDMQAQGNLEAAKVRII